MKPAGAINRGYLSLMAVATCLAATPLLWAEVIFVDAGATGGNYDGTSWATAYVHLQDALARPPVSGDEIWVANGTYMPDGGRIPDGGGYISGNGERNATFQLLHGVSIYGGFAGHETDLSERLPDVDPSTAEPTADSILSGDIGIPDESSDNSRHVVTSSAAGLGTVIDGFTIVDGNAGSGQSDVGAGWYNNGGSPTVVNCTFLGHYCYKGAGFYSTGGPSSPTLTGCVFQSNSGSWGGAIGVGGGVLTVRGCTLSQNQVSWQGAGMWVSGGAATLEDSVFVNNKASEAGGGLTVGAGSVTADGCRFIGNSAYSNGGIYAGSDGALVMRGCLVAGNSARYRGGALLNGSNKTLINCVFSGNRSTDSHGGGVAVRSSGTATITNCTFVRNRAKSVGGGIFIAAGCQPTIQNCILWQNKDQYGEGESSQISLVPSELPAINHCCIQGWSGAWGGVGNTGADPLLVDPVGTDNMEGTEDDDARLLSNSPCIDAGSNDVDVDAFDPDRDPLPETDYDGNPRFLDDPQTSDTGAGVPPLVDMGAFEFVPPDCNDNGVLDSDDIAGGTSEDCNANAIPDECEQDCNGNGLHDDCDIAAGADDCDGDDVPDECEADTDEDGFIDDCDNCLLVPNPLQDDVCQVPSSVLCVKANAFGSGDGTSWYDAFPSLQDALSAAGSDDSITEIWVAAGTYYPDEGVGQTPADRAATFNLVAGVSLYGGFGGTETQRPDRDPAINVAILSGDIGVRDYHPDNSYRLVNSSAVGSTTVIDGFTIMDGTGGTAQGDVGAGWYNNGGSPAIVNCAFLNHSCYSSAGFYTTGGGAPTLTDCVFRANSGSWGAAIGVGGGNLTVRGCSVYQNHASWQGGGMNVSDGVVILDNSTFRNNTADEAGGGLKVAGGSVTADGCRFINNSAYSNGGIYAGSGGSLVMRACVVAGNSARYRGGALLNGSNKALINCVFSGNRSTDSYGGGVAVRSSGTATITNCTFIGNNASSTGGGIYIEEGSHATIQNCILWENTDSNGDGESSQIWVPSVLPAINHCCIQGWSGVWGGVGNIDDPPLWTPDGHLRRDSSSFLDAGDNSAIPPGVTTDIDGPPEARIYNDTVDIGADEFNDTDGDGLPDWWENTYPDATDPSGDFDQDGMNNLDEYERFSSDPVATPYHVNPAHPNASDTNPGTALLPLATIQGALNLADDGDTVLVYPGTYMILAGGLNYVSKSVVVRKCDVPGICDSPDEAVLQCPSNSHVVNLSSIQGTFAALDGFTITGASGTSNEGIRTDGSRFILRNCILVAQDASGAGGGFYSTNGFPRIEDLTIRANPTPEDTADAGTISSSSVYLESELRLEADRLDVSSSWFAGPGSLFIDADRLLKITGAPGGPATVFRSDILGSGDIQIDAGHQLTVEGGAVVDLSGGAGGSCATGCVPADPELWGEITIDGALLVRDATVRNALIEVSLAEIEGSNAIINNDITLVEATTGFGGQFFVSGSTDIECNSILSRGDRYLDLDPDPLDPNLNICQNTISVEISQGVDTALGTLLELRARDDDCGTAANPDCRSGVFQTAITGRFAGELAENWVLETLEILPGAKLNLTNRPGFQYQTDLTYPETVYVKNLILRENAVLNTALQTLYYETLTQEAGSEIVDEPLLGFSLGIIAMDDRAPYPHNEFDIRIRKRLRDPEDTQFCQCDGACPDNKPPFDPTTCLEGSIERLDDADVQQEIPALNVGGVMDMWTQHPGKQSASSVAAKGAFARAGDEDIVVTFDYLFRQTDANTKLNIYLSDKPNEGERIFKVAELRPPPATMPGGTSSDRFAIFHGEFPRVVDGVYELNFTRGTYVELELAANEDEQGNRTPGAARVWIDNFDPQVVCPDGLCGIYREGSGSLIDPADYLILLAETGRAVPLGRWCLDMSKDGYVDLNDALAWDLYYNIDANLCPDFVENAGPTHHAKPAKTIAALTGDGLLIAGKPDLDVNHDDAQKDFVYDVTTGGTTPSPGQPLTCPQDMDCNYGLARLVQDANKTVYAVHGVHGVVRQDTGEAVVAPGSQTFDGKTVTIGGVFPNDSSETYYGVPLSDAAFAPDDTGPLFIYVVPVLVTVPAAGQTPEYTYKAAAKLELLGGGNYNVAAIFGSDPYAADADDCANCKLFVPGGDCTPLCDLTNVREIELDADRNVFVASGTEYNAINDWLLAYNETTGSSNPGFEIARVNLNDMFADNPDLVPSAPGAVFVSSDDRLYLTSSANMGNGLLTYVYRFAIGAGATSLTFDGVTAIDNPVPGICSQITCTDYVSSITSIQQAPDGTLYVVGFTAPKFPDNEPLPTSIDGIFTTPTLTMIPPGTAWSSPPEVLPPDFDNDGDVDQYDVEAFEACSSGPGIPYTGDCKEKDRDADGDVDQNDFGFLQRCFSGDQIPADRSCLPPSGISATPITGSDLALPISALFIEGTE